VKEDRSVLLRTEEELLAPASALPNATCLAATFDDELVNSPDPSSPKRPKLVTPSVSSPQLSTSNDHP